MEYMPVIGLEIHVQLKTNSKMFCGCANRLEDVRINTDICPVCTGQPGSLPVPNLQAVQYAIKGSLALNCEINAQSKFDRKNYFYPDLPKGYQISQFDQPIGEHGSFSITVQHADGHTYDKTVGITRLHLEEDAAKLLHRNGMSLVDYNRASTPLAEIVTEPDMRSAEEAKKFLQELQMMIRYLGISDADMEKGQMRCDVNISLLPEEALKDKDEVTLKDVELHPKTEIKNVNSFRSVERAIHHEIARQTALWDQGSPPDVTTTRGWDDTKQITTEQRTKESMGDYRYFPEPDIPPMNLAGMAQKTRLPELPADRRARFKKEYGFADEDIELFVQNKALGNYAEQVYSDFGAWLNSTGRSVDDHKEQATKLIGGWITNKLMARMMDKKVSVAQLKITGENFAEFVTLIFDKKINSTNAQKLLDMMIETGADPSHLMEEHGLGQVSDGGLITEVVEKVITAYPKQVDEYRGGKETVMKFLVGMCMKETEGSADPKLVQEELLKQLK